MKRTLVLLTIACTLVSSAAAQTVVVPKAQLQKDIWIANAKYNIDTTGRYKLIAIAAGLHAAYSADPTLTSAQMQTIIHDTETRIDSWQAGTGSGADPSEIYRKALSLMADVTADASFKAAAGIAKDLLEFTPSATPEDDWKSINAFKASEFSVDRERESAVLDSVYSDSQSSPAFQAAFDAGLGHELNGLTTDSAATLLDHNPALTEKIGLSNLTELVKSEGDSVTVSLKDLQDNLNQHIGELGGVITGDTTLLNQLNQQQADMNAYLKNAAAQQEAEQAAQNQQKLDQLQIEAADAAFQIFGKIIPGKAGTQVTQAGQVAVKIASSISDFVNNTSKLSSGLGAAVLTGNLLSAAMSLEGIFGGGPPQMDVISDQLTKLSQQIDGLQKDMDTRLNRIDSELAQIYDQENKNFQQIMMSLNAVQATLGDIRGQLVALRQQLNGVENDLITVLQNMDEKGFYESYNGFLHYYELKSLAMSQADFDLAEREYAQAVLSGNAAPEVDARLPATPGDGTLWQVLRGEDVNLPTFQNLNPKEINFVLASAGVPNAGAPLVNPHLWIIASSAYLDLANQPLSFLPGNGGSKPVVTQTFICEAAKADQFIAAGASLKNAMTGVAVAGPTPDGSYRNSVFGQQLKGYAAALDSLVSEAAAARDAWVHSSGYDPWLPTDEGPAPSLAHVSATPCSAADRVDTDTPDIWGSDISLDGAAFMKGILAKASHFVQKDTGVQLCLTNMSYSTFTQADYPQHGGIPPPPNQSEGCRLPVPFGSVTPCDIHHYVFTFAIKATARLSYDGKHISDSTFTTPPWTVQGDSFPPGVDGMLYGYEVSSHWATVKASLESAMSSGTLAPDSAAAMKAAQQDMVTFFAIGRKKLIMNAWLMPLADTDVSDIRTSADALSDYKSLIWALSQIGLPTAFDSDELFRPYVSDTDNALMDRRSMIRKLSYFSDDGQDIATQKFDFAEYVKEARTTLAAFKSLLDKKTEAARLAGGDLQEAIASGLAGLQQVENSYEACRSASGKSKAKKRKPQKKNGPQKIS